MAGCRVCSTAAFGKIVQAKTRDARLCVMFADKASNQVSKGMGKAKDKMSRHKSAPADEDPTDDKNAIIIHQEPDKQSKIKYKNNRVRCSCCCQPAAPSQRSLCFELDKQSHSTH